MKLWAQRGTGPFSNSLGSYAAYLPSSGICDFLRGKEPISITKERISIGASSTTRFVGLTGLPLANSGSFSGEPSTFQTSLFCSISSRSWLADKLISVTLLIWSEEKSWTLLDKTEWLLKKQWMVRVHCFYLLAREQLFQFYTGHYRKIFVLPNLCTSSSQTQKKKKKKKNN